ncbi:SMP-30/gluconolactonase/LRE family protein [Aquitalea denitrificans]|uniref:SMP-30/gluconolactonase/LRE family protein n=1 Tax=Aquitalea denitrificans TaxID=519081 RepID=UPI00135A240A|nr:SMP-30/gluconolactonase/LRE family protein [Aquitalea denitrificans]
MKIAIWGRQRDHVGESPCWDAVHGCLWSVDMTAQAIRRRWPDGRTDSFPTAELPAALALNPQGDMAVVAFASGTALWTPTQGLLHWLTRPETDPQLRLNEGKCDPAGRFWVASMENNLDHHGQPRATSRFAGHLWRTSGEQAIALSEAEFGCPNTMAWSPDRRYFYAGDSQRNSIWVWDYDMASGDISQRRVLQQGGPGIPDGSAMDEDGCLWTARFGGGCIVRTTPAGKTDRIIPLPVRNPTSCTFGNAQGGKQLDTLLITSARFGLSQPGPQDGAVLAIHTGHYGLPENRYRDDA